MTSDGKQISVREQAAQHLDNGRDRILAALPQFIDRERFYEIALNLVRTNTDLSRCTPASIAMAIYGCARLGLMPDPALGHVYVVPFGDVATVIPGYMGFIELARRSGKISTVHTALVHEGDEWDYYIDEHGPHILHRPKMPNGKAAVLCGYCIAQMTNGEPPQVWVMSAEDIEKRNTKSPVWKKWPDEQRRKTVVKSARKWWPLSPELAYAAQLDDQAEIGERQAISPQLDDVAHPAAADSGTDPLLQEVIGVVDPKDRWMTLVDFVAAAARVDMDSAQDLLVREGFGSSDIPDDAVWAKVESKVRLTDWLKVAGAKEEATA